MHRSRLLLHSVTTRIHLLVVFLKVNLLQVVHGDFQKNICDLFTEHKVLKLKIVVVVPLPLPIKIKLEDVSKVRL